MRLTELLQDRLPGRSSLRGVSLLSKITRHEVASSRAGGLVLFLFFALAAHAQGFLVVLDAAHGGSDTGARINDRLLEKNLVLDFSVRLRSTLAARGMTVATTRENDANPDMYTRGATANRAHPAACITLHATTSGSGVHLYTSSLAGVAPSSVGPGTAHPLRPWASAQAAYVTQSLKLSSDVRAAMSHASIPVALGSISMQPLDSFACPAMVIEFAPLLPSRTAHAAALSDASYQTSLVDAITGALEQWRSEWSTQP